MTNQITNQSEKLWNKGYTLILLTSTLSSFSFYLITTILSKHLINIEIGFQMTGFIVGLFSITSLVCRPICGVTSDRINNIKLLKAGNLLMAAGLLGFAFFKSVPLLILFRILNGIGFAINSTSQISMASKCIPSNKTGEGIGYIGMSNIIGSAVAPAWGSALEAHYGMQTAFFTAAAMALAAFAIIFFLTDNFVASEAKKKNLSLKDIFLPSAIPYTLVYGAFSFGSGVISSYLIVFAANRQIERITLYFTLYALMLIFIRPLSGKIMDRLGLKYTVFPGLILTIISMFLLGRSTTLAMVLISCILRAIGQGAAQPTLQAGCINKAGRQSSGVATSTYYLGGDIAHGLGPIIGGWILGNLTESQGYLLLFDLCGLLLAAAFIYFAFIMKKKIPES